MCQILCWHHEKGGKISKGSDQFIENSRNGDTYLTANPETTSHLRWSPPRIGQQVSAANLYRKELHPSTSGAYWFTSALQIFIHKHFLIYVNKFQHKRQGYIHSPRLIFTKEKTENYNLEVISASPGYVRFVGLLPMIQF